MFDVHIQYYAYNNTVGDDFGVGHLGNKEFWIHLMNSWNRNDGRSRRYTAEEWDELECAEDFRGCQLAEITPDEDGYSVYVVYGEGASAVDETWRISKDFKVSRTDNLKTLDGKSSPVPRWISRLKNQLREA